MSKKTPVKKSKRRLKRSARRSLAAVLMITAIAVAAIPVPENYADNGTSGGTTQVTTTDLHNMDDFGYDSKNAQDEALTKGSNFSLSEYEGESVEDLLKETDVYQSLSITDVGGGAYDLCWQFMYYKVTEPSSGADRGVICKYNDQYAANLVNLSLNPVTAYYTVTNEKYNGFYEGTEAGLKNMDVNPTQEIQYSYTVYNTTGLTDNEVDFFNKYFKTQYTAKTTEFAKYKTDLAAWNRTGNGDESTKPIEPTPLTITPSADLTSDQKLQYFCEHDTNLKKMGSGYTLRSVSNSMVGQSGTIYVAKDGTPTKGTVYSNDKEGFLVTEQSKYLMCAIGNQAFKGVSNVVNMEIPDMIGYIGNEAFADAALLESIKINNVKQIGNRAFKGCVRLASVEIAQGTELVGTECFSGTAIGEITLPVSVKTIGYGAFSNCKSLTKVNLDNIGAECVVKEYAFYNCAALQEVNMSKANITSIGEGAFAVEAGSVPLSITFPTVLKEVDSIGDYMFAGRSGLEYVVFPQDYGRDQQHRVKVPSNMFHGCANLQYVEFPTNQKTDPQACGYVWYDSAVLFSDVINSDFYVKGPKTNSGGNTAEPRESTWDAVTAVSKTVPYLYIENGVEYYEVSDGKYLICIDNKGILTSCKFKPGLSESDKKNIDLEIPAKVGNTDVVGIASDCFSDNELNQAVVSLTITDDSISTIDNSVFKGWKNLRTVIIGNSVTSIGASAFEGCESLIDVTFHTPSAGYDAFKIGDNAFKTDSDELTFHGDIVEKYAPFEYAIKPENIVQESDNGYIRICYKGLSDYLTVMYNPVTDMVTLLDYPKYSQISELLNEAHAAELPAGYTYEEWKVSEWYDKYAGSDWDFKREELAIAWQNALNSDDAEAAKEAVYSSDAYGPWVSSENYTNWKNWLPSASGGNTGDDSTSGGTSDTGSNTLLDWLFEPIVAYAAEENPKPYYDVYKYDPVDNIASNDPYRAPTTEEQNLVYATQKIVVPKGVESIDVYGYVKNLTVDGEQTTGKDRNTGNYNTYFIGTNGWSRQVRTMYESKIGDSDDNTDVVPGLFSGYYVDYTNSSDYELYKRGNDLVTEIELNSVKYLPDYAFDSCERLQSVILGPDCADIGTAPFRGCYSLTLVGDNDYYKTDNGIVYSVNTDGSYTIEECLPARGNKVGGAQMGVSTDSNLEKVSSIRDGAFEECKYITTVDLSGTAGLTEIPKDCFRNCSDLTRLSLPRTVNNIEEGAFVNDLRLVELTIPGTEVFISARAFEENQDKQWTTVYTYADSSARRYVDTYGAEDKFKLIYEQKSDEWRVIFLDANGQQVGEDQYVEDGGYATAPTLEEVEGWTFEKWLGTNNKLITDKIHEDTIFIAQGYSNNGMVNGKYLVDFYDQVDGSKIGETQYVEPGKAAIAPQAPTHKGYTFLKWSSDEYLNVQGNLTIIAMYSGTGTTSGGTTTNTSGNSTNTSNGSTNSSRNSSNSSSTSSSNTSSSTSTSSTTSGSNSTAGLYTLTVVNGSGSGSYAAGTTVSIVANAPAAGMVFSKWTTESNGVTLASVSLNSTTLVMPANNVTVTANYVAGTAATTNSTNGTGNGGSTTGNNGNTTVDITKPGISNKDLATANVNGSTDNFIVKISETDEATQAVAAALTNKYGSLDNILYYAMDITLWDATGTYQLTGSQVEGLSVDITIPIPDALVAYGGNNMAGAVINGDQLENLNESFTTINGVPCIRFTATHFSPYTIYVDTGNLTEGLLDVTPKTGDPIHPKWFLSIGLACLSIILFMKKDKSMKAKTA